MNAKLNASNVTITAASSYELTEKQMKQAGIKLGDESWL